MCFFPPFFSSQQIALLTMYRPVGVPNLLLLRTRHFRYSRSRREGFGTSNVSNLDSEPRDLYFSEPYIGSERGHRQRLARRGNFGRCHHGLDFVHSEISKKFTLFVYCSLMKTWIGLRACATFPTNSRFGYPDTDLIRK